MKRIFSCAIVAMVMFSLIGAQALAASSDFTYGIKTATEINNPNRDYLIVVNQDNPYQFGGYYDVNIQKDLTYCVNDVDGDTMAAEKAAYLAYTMLKADMERQGVKIGLYDGFRTVADQEYLISLLRTPTNPVLDPGYTECHTGLLLSVVVWDNAANAWGETLDHAQVKADFEKLHQTATDYGFIVRYPEGKEDITGLSYRPSNLRYVGSAEVAHAISDNGLTLEEYVANLGK